MTLEVRIDPGLCMGVGECIARKPGVFIWNDLKTQATVAEPNPEDSAELRDAVASCPNFAITISDLPASEPSEK